jgi:hypothetical protein
MKCENVVIVQSFALFMLHLHIKFTEAFYRLPNPSRLLLVANIKITMQLLTIYTMPVLLAIFQHEQDWLLILLAKYWKTLRKLFLVFVS